MSEREILDLVEIMKEEELSLETLAPGDVFILQQGGEAIFLGREQDNFIAYSTERGFFTGHSSEVHSFVRHLDRMDKVLLDLDFVQRIPFCLEIESKQKRMSLP